LHQAGVLIYHCMMHGNMKLKHMTTVWTLGSWKSDITCCKSQLFLGF